MGLAKYKSKRNFKESFEPTGRTAYSHKLRFVIQKHDASHLHYHFRLEMEGVLKSWAVPKGRLTNPSIYAVFYADTVLTLPRLFLDKPVLNISIKFG